MALSAVINPHGDHEENIDRMAQQLGRGKVRRAVFLAIYGRAKRGKTSAALAQELEDQYPLQSIRNELNALSKHGLVSKDEQKAARNGIQTVYGKVQFVSANKAEIIKYADNPRLREKLPTKRRPALRITPAYSSRSVPTRSAVKVVSARRAATLTVLYLTATPEAKAHLRTDLEVRAVQQEIRGSKFREKVKIELAPAANSNSILDGINDYKPQIVHFSGHAGEKQIGLGLGMSFDTLADLLDATDTPPSLLVINACDSLDGADRLLESVGMVIAMSDSISDAGAIIFASRFYAAIGGGQSVDSALKQARAAMKAALLTDADLPKLIHRSDADPKQFRLT